MNPNVTFMQEMYAAFNRESFFETMAGKETGHKLDPLRRRGRHGRRLWQVHGDVEIHRADLQRSDGHLVRIRDGKIYHHQAFADKHAVAEAHRA